jgi:hypothetical protein
MLPLFVGLKNIWEACQSYVPSLSAAKLFQFFVNKINHLSKIFGTDQVEIGIKQNCILSETCTWIGMNPKDEFKTFPLSFYLWSPGSTVGLTSAHSVCRNETSSAFWFRYMVLGFF